MPRSDRTAHHEWRAAGPDDALLLTDLERAANLASLGHVFAPDRHPYPYDDVHARWRRTRRRWSTSWT
jgi:hypothetical protein